MTKFLPALLLLLASSLLSAESVGLSSASDTAADSWRTLFDGQSLNGWRNYGAAPGAAIKGWVVENGELTMTRELSSFRFLWLMINPFGSQSTLDLMTEELFEDFELSLEWKISAGGNSGIFYLVGENAGHPVWHYGLEMQVLDDAAHYDGRNPKRRAAALYDIKAAQPDVANPVGEWNRAKIRVDGDRIEHWLNGVLVLEVDRAGEEWDALVSASKFKDIEGFGQARRGRIVLQDHGDRVWYRNIQVRVLNE